MRSGFLAELTVLSHVAFLPKADITQHGGNARFVP
jgi:hypothetical protein